MIEEAHNRVIGLNGAIATIIGFVIGVSVFILPGTLAAQTGPAVIISYAVASIVGLFACIVGAAIGIAYPRSGASFLAVSEQLGLRWGFLTVWLLVGGGALAVALIGLGIADYLDQLISVDRRILAFALVLLLGLINLLGISIGTAIQIMMVIAFLSALTVFLATGLPNIKISHLQPLAPYGWNPVIAAALPAYFSYGGFLIIIELAGEVRNPERDIPRSIFISYFIVLIVYLLVSLVLVGVVHYSSLNGVRAPIAFVASEFLSPMVVLIISATAAAAGASSINGALLGYSRDLQALTERNLLARRRLLFQPWMAPDSLGIVPITVAALLAIVVDWRMDELAIQTVMALLCVQIMLGIAAFKMATCPELDIAQRSRLLRGTPLRLFGIALVVSSLLVMLAVLFNEPTAGLSIMIYLALGLFAFQRVDPRSKQLNPEGKPQPPASD